MTRDDEQNSFPDGETRPDGLFEEGQERNEERFAWPEDLFLPSDAVPKPEAIAPLEDLESHSPEEVLRHYWGYESFRPTQREIIDSALSGHDTLGLLPTGGGKSITFQVPALLLPGVALVITPLISLMKDQVLHLRAKGIKATAIHSGMSPDKIRQTIDNCIYGGYKFLYVSPERLQSTSFLERLGYLNLSLIVVDECHCICQWGYDFRPSYLNIAKVRELFPAVPVLALTATATPSVVEAIQSSLGFRAGSQVHQRSFFRPNLSYSTRHTPDKRAMIVHILSRVQGSAIIYCRSREMCRTLAKYLEEKAGQTATYFHAGLTHLQRDDRQTRWMRGEYRVMVATNAFGMGIDKPDVRLVIHWAMPSSLEEYFQEAGRAGRDGQRAYSVVLVGERDASTLQARLPQAFPPRERILEIYSSICSYLSIGEGEGLGHSYDFDLEDFCHVFRHSYTQVRSAIEIMQVGGWLSYREDETRSYLMITCQRSELYAPWVGHDVLLRTILRLYAGLFADFVSISERNIALLTSMTEEQVYRGLTELARMGLLVYVPKSNTPRLIFHIRREEPHLLRLPKSAYEDRRDRLETRLEASLGFIMRGDCCRSRLLLSYFGEEMPHSCGICDVCLQRTDEGLRHSVVEDVRALTGALIAEGGGERIDLGQVLERLPYPEAEVVEALRYLSAREEAFALEASWICPQGEAAGVQERGAD